MKANPVELARPKVPKVSHESQALGDETLRRLLSAVPKERLTGARDHAMLLWYLLTGHRRSEVFPLRWRDLAWEGDTLTVRFLVKGGDYVTEIVNLLCWEALRACLAASGRLESMGRPDTPLWIGHDRAGQANVPLSSHSFAQNLKRYARQAGPGQGSAQAFRPTQSSHPFHPLNENASPTRGQKGSSTLQEFAAAGGP